MPTGCVAAIGFVVAGGYPSELFDLCKVVLDEMPPFVGSGVIVTLVLAVRFRGDHCACTSRVQFLKQPIRIERFVCQERPERNIPDQRGNALHVMRLTWQQQEADKVAKRIHQSDDLGCQAAARTPDGLILSPPFAPVAFW